MTRRLAAPVLLCAIVIAFFWKLTLTRQYTWLASPDVTLQVMPWFQFQAREWHHLRLPLWDPYSWAGHPFLAQAQPGAAYPLNWLLFLLPFSWTALNWYYVATRVLAALTFYALCRGFDRSRRASVIAAAAYGVGGYLGSVAWPQMANGAVWAPLVLLYQLRSARGDRPLRNAILSGFFLGLCWLCGHHQMPLFLTLGSAALWIFLSWRRLPVALIVGLMVSAFQTLPTAEYGRLALRWASFGDPLRWSDAVPYEVHEKYSVTPLSLWSIVIPEMDYNVSAILGIAAFTLALIGLVKCWSDLRVRALAWLALGGLLFALGPATVMHGVIYALVPMVEKARVPAQALILFHLGACALVAFGFDAIPALSRRAAAWIAAALFAFAAALSFGGMFLFFQHVLAINGDTRFMMTALAAALTAGLLLAVSRGALTHRVAAAMLLGLSLIEIANVSTYFFARVDDPQRMADLRKMSQDGDIRLFLAAQQGKPRISVDMDVIPYNVGHWWGMEVFDAYLASAPTLLWDNAPFSARTRSLLGIRYFVGKKPQMPDQAMVFQGASGANVYQFPDAMPRVWTVHKNLRVNAEQARRLLADNAWNLRESSFSTLPAGALESCPANDEVRMAAHLADSVTIEATMACRGLVVLDDQFFPGWSATVDGDDAAIVDAYGLVRGVVVGAGKHEIEFEYRPWQVIAGAALSALGALIALGAAVVRRRKPRSLTSL